MRIAAWCALAAAVLGGLLVLSAYDAKSNTAVFAAVAAPTALAVACLLGLLVALLWRRWRS